MQVYRGAAWEGWGGTSGVTVLALHGGWILIEAQRIKLLKIRLSLLVLFLILHHLPHRSPSLPPSPPLLDLYFPVGHDCEPFFFSFPLFFSSLSLSPIPGFLSRGFLLIPANQTFAIRHYDEDEPTRSLASNWRRGREGSFSLSTIELGIKIGIARGPFFSLSSFPFASSNALTTPFERFPPLSRGSAKVNNNIRISRRTIASLSLSRVPIATIRRDLSEAVFRFKPIY